MNINLNSAVFSGNESLLLHCAEAWLNAGQAVCAVVTARPRLVAWAQARAIKVFADEASVLALPEVAFDYHFSVADPCALPGPLLARARKAALGFHNSLSLRPAGWHAPAWALMAQQTVHGVAWRDMASAHEGRIARHLSFDIPPGETALSLQARCHEAGLASFESLVQDIGRDALHWVRPANANRDLDRPPCLQALGLLDFTRPASELLRLVSALDFGPYPNPVARAKLYLGDTMLLVGCARIEASPSGAAPGTVLRVGVDSVCVATANGDIVLGGLSTPWGQAPGHGLAAGQVMPLLDERMRARLAARAPAVSQGEFFWRKAFATLAPVELPYPHKPAAPQQGPRRLLRVRLQTPTQGTMTVAAFVGWLSALTGQERISVLYSDSELKASAKGLECWLSPWVPLTLDTAPGRSAQQAAEHAAARIARVYRAGPCPRDLPLRLGGKPGAGERCGKIGISLNGAAPAAGADLVMMTDPADQYLELVANAAVFSIETLEAMASHLAVYLKAFEGAASTAAISLLPESEAAMVTRMNATQMPYDAGLGIHEAIAAQTAQAPQRTAISFRGQTLTYRELDDQASALAVRLAQSGVRAGDVVGLCLERGPELVVGVLAILKSGAAYLPLDPEYPHDRLLYMIEDSGTPLILTSRAVTATFAIPEDKVLLIDGQAPAQAVSRAPAQAQGVAYLIYTSGSTGRPKGVVLRHRNVLNLFTGLDARIAHQPPGIWLAVSSICFDMSVVELWWALARGFTIELYSNSAALPYVSLPQAILRGQATHLQCTPSMASMLVADAEGRQALSRLSVLMVGGEALSLKLAGELRALVPGAFFNMYGPTETTVWSTACELAEIGSFAPLGQAIANTRLFVRTPHGAECPALVAGELLIGGAGVSAGYWKRPELTAERFIADTCDAAEPGARLYRTGDLVRRHPDGAIEFLGRIDHQVKIRGHRIELGEIESVLLRQRGVKEAVVIAREDAAGDWSLAAYVAPQAGVCLDTEQIRRGIAEKLTDIMVPRTILVLQAFPLTPNGKVDRRALPALKAAPKADPSAAPQSPLEIAIAKVWEQVLGLPGASATDSFFDLGGSLYLALQAQRRLAELAGQQVSLSEVVLFPSARALAAHLDKPGCPGYGLAAALAPQAAPDAPAQALPALPDEKLTRVESVIAGMWRELFGIEDITREDDFFALGGHSLTAIRLFAQLRNQYAVELPLATLFQESSLAGFSTLVAQCGDFRADAGESSKKSAESSARPSFLPKWTPLVCVQRGKPGRAPLYCVHGAGGNVFNFKIIAQRLDAGQPVYGLQPQGVDGYLPVLPSIEAMAEQYVKAIRAFQPEGPYRLLGYSAGGLIALEMALQLRKAGAEVGLLSMIDTPSPTAAAVKLSVFRKLWLMRRWSFRFAYERLCEKRREKTSEAASYQQVLDKLSRGEWLEPELVEHYLFHNIVAAERRYEPAPYEGSIVLFRATDEVTQNLHAGERLGWESHVSGPIKVIRIPGSHNSMMKVDPGLGALALALEGELGSANSAASRPLSGNVIAPVMQTARTKLAQAKPPEHWGQLGR